MDDFVFEIIENKKASADAYRMVLKGKAKLPEILGGQFVQLQIPNRPDMSLRRPLGICQYDDYSITLFYAVVGKGTAVISGLQAGEIVKCALPLGNGFYLKNDYKNVALIGRGLGVVPLLPVQKSYPDKKFKAYLGFKSAAHIILKDEFEKACHGDTVPDPACHETCPRDKVYEGCIVTTDDGSYGKRGFPTDVLRQDLENDYRPDVLLVCGPNPMMKAVRNIAITYNIDAYMTGENRMGCGVGACLVCTCAVQGYDGEYHNLRSCLEGPVFDLKKVKL